MLGSYGPHARFYRRRQPRQLGGAAIKKRFESVGCRDKQLARRRLALLLHTLVLRE
jgi:hypothetical protein